MPDPCNSGCESVLFKESHAKWKDKIQVSFYVLFKWIDALYNPKIQQLWAFQLLYLIQMVLMSFLSLSRLSKQKRSDSASQDRKSSRKNQIKREKKRFQSLKKHLQSHTLQKWKPEWRARPLARFQAKKVQAERTGGISLRSVTKLERSSWAA